MQLCVVFNDDGNCDTKRKWKITTKKKEEMEWRWGMKQRKKKTVEPTTTTLLPFAETRHVCFVSEAIIIWEAKCVATFFFTDSRNYNNKTRQLSLLSYGSRCMYGRYTLALFRSQRHFTFATVKTEDRACWMHTIFDTTKCWTMKYPNNQQQRWR